jgi:glycosyltransferase involved in cell wall biosynthesis
MSLPKSPPAVARTAEKTNLLFLCQTLPYPPDGGVTIRSYNILRLLARRFDITLICLYRRATSRSVEQSTTALARLATTFVYPIEQEHSRARLLADHVLSVATGVVYTRYAYSNRSLRARLRSELASRSFAMVHVDSLDLSSYLPEIRGIPVACTHHNVESALLERRARLAPRSARAAYFRLQATLMRREERLWAPRVGLNVMVSDADATLLRRDVPDARTVVIPNGVDTTEFRPGDGPERGIVFVGGMTWFPNRDALEYFASDLLPRLRAIGVDAPVTWVGRALPGAAEHYAPSGIKLTGYVDDVKPAVQAAACYVVPLRVGGGTRLKILDAWAMGKAIVSTSVGCEGLDARDGWNILIRDDPDAFAEAVRRVLEDRQLRERLEANARATAEQQYEWDLIGGRLVEAYDALLGSASSTFAGEATRRERR